MAMFDFTNTRRQKKDGFQTPFKFDFSVPDWVPPDPEPKESYQIGYKRLMEGTPEFSDYQIKYPTVKTERDPSTGEKFYNEQIMHKVFTGQNPVNNRGVAPPTPPRPSVPLMASHSTPEPPKPSFFNNFISGLGAGLAKNNANWNTLNQAMIDTMPQTTNANALANIQKMQERVDRQKVQTELAKTYQPQGIGGLIGSQVPEIPLWLTGEGAVTKLGAKFIPKTIQEATPAIVGRATKTGATWAGVVAPAETMQEGSGLPGYTEKLKETPYMIAGGELFHQGGKLIGKAIPKEFKDFVSQKYGKPVEQLKPDQQAEALAAWNDITNAYKSPSLRDVRQQEYEQLFANPRINANTAPDELRLGRAAGVVPDLRPREIPTPQPGLPAPLPQRILPEQPAPRMWTNRDNIPLEPPQPPRIEQSNLTPPRITPPQLGNRSMAAAVENPTATMDVNVPSKLGFDPTQLKDISGFQGATNDVDRIFRNVFGEQRGQQMLENFYRSKEANVDMQTYLVNELKKEIVDKLGIKKAPGGLLNSIKTFIADKAGIPLKDSDSALVQKYGEGLITKEQLQKLAPDRWQNIVEADNWFRSTYNQVIDQVNASKKAIYPNAERNLADIEAKIQKVNADTTLTKTERNEKLKILEQSYEDALRGKIIPKRKDYYRHWQEMSNGIQGLLNIFDSPAGVIDPRLIGTSEFTKPLSKWASFAQKRVGNQTKYDAVGGFLNYIPQASYATHIDPNISYFRNLQKELATATKDSKNLTNTLQFLEDYANDLAGKTNPFDRPLQKLVSRKVMQGVALLNNRVKGNMVLGKASSALAQFANVPQGIAFAKQYSVKGLGLSVRALNGMNTEMAKSPFLKERFGGAGSKLYRQFDESLLNKPKDFAIWMMETADKVGTTFIWNSAYAKGVAEKVADPIRFADVATRRLVAGRGVGEVPLLQKSTVFQVLAPFQLEVANLWRVQGDFIKSKDFGGLIALYLLNYTFNKVMEATKGSGVTFDPIQAGIDATGYKVNPNPFNFQVTDKNENLTPAQRVGRVAGEVLSNTPGGQTIAATVYPENGWGGLGTRKQLFGSNDPTRFGSGLVATRGLQDPLYKVLMPFGGDQLKKTVEGIKGLNAGGVFAPNGQLKYPVSPTLPNKIRGALFGPSAFGEAQNYYNNNERPLSADQTKQFQQYLQQNPANGFNFYNSIQKKRDADRIMKQLNDTWKQMRAGQITENEAQKRAKRLQDLLSKMNQAK